MDKNLSHFEKGAPILGMEVLDLPRAQGDFAGHQGDLREVGPSQGCVQKRQSPGSRPGNKNC